GPRGGGPRPRPVAGRGPRRPAGADDDALASVGPGGKAEHGVVRAAAEHHRVDAVEEHPVAVLLVVEALEPVESAVRPSDEAVEADGDKDGEADFHRALPRIEPSPSSYKPCCHCSWWVARPCGAEPIG